MIKIIFNSLLGLVLIFVWSRFVDLGQIFATISRVDFLSLVPVFLLMLASPIIRAIRLKIFLSEIKKINLLNLIYLNGAAMMLNFFIPIRAGELVKGVYLNTKYNLHLGKSVVWIFIDRFVDFLTVLFIVAVLFFVIPTSLPLNFIIIIIFITIIIVILVYLIIHQANFAKKLFNLLRHIFILKSIKIYFDKFSTFILESFSILDRHPKDLILMIGITILAYIVDGAVWYFTFIAIGAPQDFFKMYLGQALSALIYLIPAAPGYIGSAEASGLVILSGIFGMDPNLASSMTVLFHILTALFVLIFGLISIYSLKINLGIILKKALKRS